MALNTVGQSDLEKSGRPFSSILTRLSNFGRSTFGRAALGLLLSVNVPACTTKEEDQTQQILLDAQEKGKLSAFVDREYGEAGADRQISSVYNFDTPQQILLAAQEQERLSAFVDREYGEARADLQESGLYNFDNPPQQGPRSKPAPTLEEAKAQLLAKLTPAQIEVVKRMQKPVLQLKPKRKKDAYITALNSKKPMPGYDSVTLKMDEMWNDRDVVDGFTSLKGDKIVGWQVGFIEGADGPNLLPGDDINKTLGQRCEWFAQEYGQKGVQGADFRSYTLLQIRGLRKTPPRPIDDMLDADQTWTMLNGEPMKDSMVAGARWDYDVVIFDGDHRDGRSRHARFRASVMVDVD